MDASKTPEAVNAEDTLQPEETAELLEETGPQQTKPTVQESQDSTHDLEFLFDVPLQVSVEVGRARILLKDLLQMGEGYVVELDKFSGDPLDLYVNSRLIARGEAVKVGDKFGIKLTEVVSQSDRIAQLG
jgi:flagellar motor switch protein FliN/FliY